MFIAALLLATAGTVQGYTMVNSGYIMRKNIDSIVQPGRYTSHMHSFFGNDAVNATTSTTEELMSGCATNSNPNDLSVYWHPTLYANNGTDLVPIEARYFKAYYQEIHSAEIPFPTDFKVVAGNATASTAEDVNELWTMSWWCEYGPETAPDSNGWPNAGCNLGRLQTQLRFPDCVNPNTLASDYSSRAWLPNANRCPEGMKRIPQLRFSVRFDTTGVLPDGWSGEAPLQLSSGNAYSWHGDFINGWLPEAAENMMLATDKREFQSVTGSRSEMESCIPADVDPENGTSDYDESLRMMEGASASVATSQVPASTTAPIAASSTPVWTSIVRSSTAPSPVSSSVASPTQSTSFEAETASAVETNSMDHVTSARPHHGSHGDGRWRGCPRS